MKTGAESIGDETKPGNPDIKALPTPTEADGLRDQIATLVAANSGLGEKLTDATAQLEGIRELQERTSHELAQTKAQFAEATAEIAAKNNALREVNVALDERNKEIENLTTERDEAVAQWEEWSAHPFFSAVLELTRQSNGKPVTEELAEKMKELVDAVADTGKGGTVSLVLGAKPMDGHEALVIGAKVTSKLPKGDPDTAIVFMTAKGTMTSEDPKQKRLPLSGDRKMKPKTNPAAELEKAKAANVTEIPAEEPATEGLSEAEEEIYERAAQIAEGEKVTTPILQRRLKIGYNIAAKIFAALKERGALVH